MRYKVLDPALDRNLRIGAKALDRRGAGKDRAGVATLRNEATGKILIRCRRLGFPSDPFAQIPCAPPRKGAIAVDSAKVRQMIVPGLPARAIGSAPCREGGCHYVEVTVGAGIIKKK